MKAVEKHNCGVSSVEFCGGICNYACYKPLFTFHNGKEKKLTSSIIVPMLSIY